MCTSTEWASRRAHLSKRRSKKDGHLGKEVAHKEVSGKVVDSRKADDDETVPYRSKRVSGYAKVVKSYPFGVPIFFCTVTFGN